MALGRPLRILHVLTQTELTGSEVFAQALVAEQARSGHKVWVLADALHLEFACDFVQAPVSQTNLAARWECFWRIRNLVREQKIDVIHCHSRGACRHANLARIGTPAVQVSTLHGRQHPSRSKRLLNQYGTLVAAICENLQTTLGFETSIPPSRIRLIRNAVDLSKDLGPQVAPAMRPQILLVGRTSGPKGERQLRLLQELVPMINAFRPQFRVLFVTSSQLGKNRLSQELEALQSRFPDHFSVLVKPADLKQTMRNSFLVVGAGRVAIEGAVLRRPVFVFGENSWVGRLSSQNLGICLASNFGDIGTQAREQSFNAETCAREILSFTIMPPQTAELETLGESLQREFSSVNVAQLTEELYRDAMFLHFVPQWIPTLMYHKVVKTPLNSPHRIFITRENFFRHLSWFKSWGFTTLRISEIQKYWQGELSWSSFPKRPLVITFDDGYRDNLENALPALSQFGLSANLFLLADKQISHNTWDQDSESELSPLLSPDERKQITASALIEIGSHGFSHADLPRSAADILNRELTESRLALEKELGIRAPVAFAYPFGRWNQAISQRAHQAGYWAAVCTDSGAMAWGENRHQIFRVNVFPEDGWWAMRKKTRSGYRARFLHRHGPQKT